MIIVFFQNCSSTISARLVYWTAGLVSKHAEQTVQNRNQDKIVFAGRNKLLRPSCVGSVAS